jgi:acetyltransferase-like isoleucine patch superfamily enzyme
MKFISLIKNLAYFVTQPRRLAYIGKAVRIALPRKIRGNKISIDDRTVVASHAWIEAIERYGDQIFEPRINIGKNVHIGRYATITAVNQISIGDNCLMSEYVYISDHAHDVFTGSQLPLVKMPLIDKGKVSIGKNCFIGFRAIIMPGVTLGDQCIVGAASVVTHSFPPKSVLAGTPARLLRTLE